MHLRDALLIALSATFCLGACGCKKKQSSPTVQVPVPAPTPAPVAAPPMSEGRLWVHQKIGLYPELGWLMHMRSHVEPSGGGPLYSEQIFGRRFIEFDRSLMKFYSLKLILEGSDKAYQEFTAAQPENIRLSKESFKTLHEQAQHLINSQAPDISPDQMQNVLEVALILKIMNKADISRNIFRRFGANASDPETFYRQAIAILKNNPGISHSFSRLSPPAKQLLLRAADQVSYGQLIHLESEPSLNFDPAVLSFNLLVYTCEVAGSLGHLNQTSSLAYTEPMHRVIQAFAAQPDAYLATRASWLGFDASELLLTRLGAMLEFFTPEEGAALKNAFSQLSSEDQQKMLSLDFERISSVSALLLSLYQNPALGATPSERLPHAIARGVPFIVRVVEAHPNASLHFHLVAEAVKTSPDLLNYPFRREADGTMVIDMPH